MKGRKKTLFQSFILFLCCILLCGVVFADTGSLRVTILNQKIPVKDIAVELCLVADLEGETYTLTEDFADLHVSPEDMVQELSAEQAEQVCQYVMQKELEGTIVLTDWEGNADYYTISDGLYLVFERGGQAVAFRPYLITIPTDGKYSIYSVPKTNSDDVKNIAVFKEWDDNEDAAGKRPETISVTLSHNGTAIRSVALNEACGWAHTFLMLTADGVYTVEEAQVPNYTCNVEEVFEGFLLTNVYTPEPDDPGPTPRPPHKPEPPYEPERPEEPEWPEEPEVPEETEKPGEPMLPQTGFRMWPVYGMLALGVVLTVLGLTDVCLGKEETWEEEQEEP